MPEAPRRRAPPPRLRPHFTLGILYVLAFFFLYCFLLVAPELWRVLTSMPAGPEQQEAAERIAREALRPRLGIAVLAALISVGLGMYWGLLPGTRRR